MRISIVSVEDSLISVGVRKVSSFIKRLNPDTTSYYIPLTNYRSFRSILRPGYADTLDTQIQARRMAERVAHADIVAFSAMTHVAKHTQLIIQEVRRINPSAYVVWGGIHPIIVPEDAIAHADAICTGEGEFAFEEFFDAFCDGRDFTSTRNFWFNYKGRVIRNGFRPLMTSSEMNTLPRPTYGRDELVYRARLGTYSELTPGDYINNVGSAYNTVWVIGCPFKCTYCGNTKFIENDTSYTRLRHSSPSWVVDEIAAARRVHPHITSVVFHDDSFLALPTKVLEEFGRLYKERIRLPFCIQGVIPNFVRREKIEVLLDAGLNRVRMGIQSGSERILKFYKRPSPPKKILEAAEVLADYSRYMIPPAYDMIVDNPIETREDVIETLELTYRMRRPFTFNMYSLRVMPNTDLAKQFESLDISTDEMATRNYHDLNPTYANCLLMLLSVFRPPRWLFRQLLKPVKAMSRQQPQYRRLLLLVRLLMLSKRQLSHLRFMDFSVVPGRMAWLMWRLGIVRFWNRHLVPKFRRKSTVSQTRTPSATGTPGPTHTPGPTKTPGPTQTPQGHAATPLPILTGCGEAP